jgi:hypothetical protein
LSSDMEHAESGEGRGWPIVRRLEQRLAAFPEWKAPARFAALTLATLYLLIKIAFYLTRQIGSRLKAFSEAGDRAMGMSLAYFDGFLIVCVIALLLFLLTMMCGRPGAPRKPFDRLPEKPIFALMILFPAIFFLLGFGPLILSRLLVQFDIARIHHMHPLLPNGRYLFAAGCASLALSMSFAQLNAKTGLLQWLPVAIFLAPPPLTFGPILWWNALARRLPSRYWSAWKPLLAFLTCLLPVVAFPASQPFMENYPLHAPETYRFLTEPGEICFANQTIAIPGRPEFLSRCNENLRLYRRSGEGEWKIARTKTLGFLYKRASADFGRDRLYIFDGLSRNLNVLTLSDFETVAQVPIPIAAFPTPSWWKIHQALDAERGILALADNAGNLATFDTQDFHPIRFMGLDPRGDVWGIEADSQTGELFVLQAFRLSVFRIDTLELTSRLDLNEAAYWMLFDDARNRILLSFPSSMKIVAFDRTMLAEVAACNAPAGVRALAIDPTRDMLFASAGSGVVETRWLDDLALIRRTRLIPWIHWLGILPEFGEAIVTAGDVRPVVWRFDPAADSFDLGDMALQLTEETARRILRFTQSRPALSRFLPGAKPDAKAERKVRGSETILLAMSREADREMGRVILERAGYEALVVSETSSLGKILEQRGREIRGAILDESFSSSEVEKLRHAQPAIRVLQSSNEPGRIPSGAKPETFVITPFEQWNLLIRLRDELDRKP